MRPATLASTGSWRNGRRRIICRRAGCAAAAGSRRRRTALHCSGMPEQVYRFVEALRQLLEARSPTGFETRWAQHAVEPLGWDALARARVKDVRRWEAALDEADGLLLRLLDRVAVLASANDATAVRVRTFRLATLERMQHATAAALVAQRFGPAGLRTVVADAGAPVARRYFAFLALAERHRRREWPLFARYLTPDAHHAFVGAAAEAARFYPELAPAAQLVALFEAVRHDLHLREFLSPRILESLYVLGDARTLEFFRDLLTAGHTHQDPERCEVTRALVMVRRFTGRLEPNAKFPDVDAAAVIDAVDRADAVFARHRDVLEPVVVI